MLQSIDLQVCATCRTWKGGIYMRIDALNMVSQVYQASKPSKINKTNAVSRTDEVQISSFGRELQIAKQAVNSASDIRSDLTSSIKSSIDKGTYSVSGEDFASKLLEKYEAKGLL